MRTDGTSSQSSSSEEVPKPRPANTAYERYKQELHAFFNGEKPLPEHLKDMLATRPGAAEHGLADEAAQAEQQQVKEAAEQQAQAQVAVTGKKGKKGKNGEEKNGDKKVRRVINGPGEDVLELVEAIRRANSPREVEQAVDALRARGVSLPKDAEVLSKALGHGNEDVLSEALRGLLDVDKKDIKSPTLLKTRVKNVALLASTSELKDLCNKMQQRLA